MVELHVITGYTQVPPEHFPPLTLVQSLSVLQSTQPVWVLFACFGEQEIQLDEPAVEYFPSEQVVQLEAPAAEYVPALHFKQLDEPAVE